MLHTPSVLWMHAFTTRILSQSVRLLACCAFNEEFGMFCGRHVNEYAVPWTTAGRNSMTTRSQEHIKNIRS